MKVKGVKVMENLFWVGFVFCVISLLFLLRADKLSGKKYADELSTYNRQLDIIKKAHSGHSYTLDEIRLSHVRNGEVTQKLADRLQMVELRMDALLDAQKAVKPQPQAPTRVIVQIDKPIEYKVLKPRPGAKPPKAPLKKVKRVKK